MLASPARERVLRVLSLFPHPRYSGHALVDEDGLVRPATFNMQVRRFPTLDRRVACIEQQIAESVRVYRPDLVVIVRPSGCAWIETVAERSVSAARATTRPVDVISLGDVEQLFHEPGGEEYDRLGQALTAAFFPELAVGIRSWVRGGEPTRRAIRPMWKAAAGAIAVLARHRPDVVVALARRPLPPGLTSLIDDASRIPDV